ncbi:MAG: phosphoribosyl-AMP cyclohydrolase [Endomicrobium sp.]|nr:phosphoribosyl-AMP cyclohydrolase [Endomicrobium sp.]
MNKIIDILKFDNKGLIPVVVQDYKDNTVLMVAYMNSEAVDKTLKTGIATYWSRSRSKLWVKGEQSGNIQKLKEFYYDCDKDCLLIKVTQVGVGAACHTGYRSCFFSKINLELINKTENILSECIGKKLFDPDQVYKKSC